MFNKCQRGFAFKEDWEYKQSSEPPAELPENTSQKPREFTRKTENTVPEGDTARNCSSGFAMRSSRCRRIQKYVSTQLAPSLFIHRIQLYTFQDILWQMSISFSQPLGAARAPWGLQMSGNGENIFLHSEASSGNCSVTLSMTILPTHRHYNLKTGHTNKCLQFIVQKSEALEDSDQLMV